MSVSVECENCVKLQKEIDRLEKEVEHMADEVETMSHELRHAEEEIEEARGHPALPAAVEERLKHDDTCKAPLGATCTCELAPYL